jgi:hypothetical protein
MTKAWAPVIVIDPADRTAVAALDLPFSLVVVSGHDPLALTTPQGIALPPEAVLRDALAQLALSPAGAAGSVLFADAWERRFGAGTALALIDLSAVAPPDQPAAALRALARAMTGTQNAMVQRNRQLMRDLAEMRITHDQTQAAFAALEGFFYQNGGAERRLFRELSPLRTQPPCLLAPGAMVEQRLPCDSTGLSDIALCLPKESAPGTGVLTVSLELAESGAQIAEWRLEAAELHPGWLRLALDRALGPDAQTPNLRLQWEGTEQLRLVTSVLHPDPRFQPRPGAALLAMQVWKYIPGTRASAAAGSHMVHGADPVDRWLLGRSVMTAAADSDAVGYSELFAGLMVRPGPEDGSSARLEGALAPGVRHVAGGVKTEQDNGPVVEYAMAAAPAAARPRSAGSLPDFAPGLRTEWLALPPGKWSQLHLFLPAALAEVHDLYLLTRLAPGETAPATPPEACFFTLTAEVDHGR